MKDLEEQRVSVKFCVKLAKTFTETFQTLQQAYGEDCSARTQRCEWFRIGQNVRRRRSQKTGRASVSTDDDHVERVLASIRDNRRLTLQEVAEEVGIGKSSCRTILADKLQMHRVVPRLLTDEQKANRVAVGQESLDR